MTLSGLGHRFPNAPWLFQHLSYEFQPGMVYALTGPSGSGKSTLLSLIAKLDKPSAGRITHEGIGQISWVFQNPFGTPRRTALDHVALPFLAAGSTIDQAEESASELLRRFQLDRVAGREFRELSGGEAQRLMLARGLATHPSLLLVDEPTAQLDRVTAAAVDAGIVAIADPTTIVLIATHDPNTRDACTAQLDLTPYAHAAEA
ncbi:ATP-binding cassette domain-containing protein [Agromyces soli]|uniref:ATP-binding cassette domain-containing protein n=1 Tax=Agromyces soli TaxID=659012 RepID=A0ABY4AZJ8_9MICO|nr:ATP-binding cassette domain-containing protein [Agromyces soli]UOE27186.1 ATP-binding cassette domain-containing protein [Agromyces soli]